ncbi:hypothetical protein HDU93_004040 [Gonapodya sp. JEL0774]|nr:hypothetical protein HDU93_004040 [Gonapodya sp. JEL0774]
MMLLRPQADIPIIQCSLLSTLDAADHYKMGEALAPLRDEGVAILGSGTSFHNMRLFQATRFGQTSLPKKMFEDLKVFGKYLEDACTSTSPEDRKAKLIAWSKATGGRIAHEREEHLLPLLVCAGAGGHDVGKLVWEEPDTTTPPVHSYVWK